VKKEKQEYFYYFLSIIAILVLLLFLTRSAKSNLATSPQSLPTPTIQKENPPAKTTLSKPTTVDFDNKNSNTLLFGNGYGGINWGSELWRIKGPFGINSTNSLIFADPTFRQASFNFNGPSVVQSIDIYNNGGEDAQVLLSCSGNVPIKVKLSSQKMIKEETHWQKGCLATIISVLNGKDISFDNLIFAKVSTK
jgi:hypothetical protein